MSTIEPTTTITATWKSVPQFEKYYQVSPDGNIKSLHRTIIRSDGQLCNYPEKSVTTRINNWGYEEARLTRNFKTHTCMVHRIVAQAFVSNPGNKPFVNHINGVKVDNRFENLEWVTHSENIQHAYDSGLILNNKGCNHHAATIVINDSTGELWGTIQEAAKAMNINYSTLRNQLRTQGATALRTVKATELKDLYPLSEN